MSFGSDFAKFLEETDCTAIIYILNKHYGMPLTEIVKEIQLKNDKNYRYAWEIAKDMSYENKIELLDLFYETDRRRAIDFMKELFRQYIMILERKKLECE
jgi:hypothetical protein